MRPPLFFLLEHLALFHANPPGDRQRGLLHNGGTPPGRQEEQIMAAQKKKNKFSATKAVKSLAREAIGSPPPVQRIPTLKESRKEEKHKPTLGKLLAEE
jgi:hypothetical protein